jgi:ubiquitin C-terminal hydrolase
VSGISNRLRANVESTRPSLSLVTPQAEPGWRKAEEQTYELELSFDALTLIYKSLQAAKALGALPPQDELLNDTIQLVDQALNRAA